MWEPGTKQATPRPVPGPSTAIGAPNAASPPPTGYKSAAVRSGNDKAVASKSFKIWTLAKLNAAHSSGASIVHSELVGPVAELVGIEGGVVSGVFNLESSGVEAPDRRPRHEEHYHEA